MQKIKQKQIELLKLQQQQTDLAYHQSLINLLHEDESIQIILQYSKKILTQNNATQNLNQYSPIHISRLIFQQQLDKIQKLFNILPKKAARIHHFVVIMMKVIKFPFQKCPYYIIGLKEMFNQIVAEDKNSITYAELNKYVLGEVVSFKDEEDLNTEFEIHFVQNKMQDYLMHDNGVKKIYYSKDLKKYLVLDQNSSIIKIYDLNMKIITKFEPNKDKHNKKHPIILNFDYNQMSSKLALIMADKTLTIVHLQKFLEQKEEEFRQSVLNQVVYPTKERMERIYFIAMMNKWITISEQNTIWIFDVEKLREQHQKYVTQFKHPNEDYQIIDIIELIPLSAIAFVINNQIHFYNQVLTKKKFRKYIHCDVILKCKYCQQRDQFYVCGNQKTITIFNIQKNTNQFKQWTFGINRIIKDFAFFPFYGTLVIIDQNNDLRLYNENQKTLSKIQNYQHIIKKKNLQIQMVKTSKTQFIIHATYIIVMQQEKVAIQKDSQYTFLNYFHYDQKKEELYFSVNNQIMSISLLHGQIKKNYTQDNSNLCNHSAFHLGRKTQLFLIDENCQLFDIHKKSESKSQFTSYKKKPGIPNMLFSFYDEEFKNLIMINKDSIYQVRNDSNNNFTVRSSFIFEEFPKMKKAFYCKRSKMLSLICSEQVIYQMMSTNYHMMNGIKYQLTRKGIEQNNILDIAFDSKYGLDVIFTNHNQVYLVSKMNPEKQLYVNLQEFMPRKLRQIKFTSFKYQMTQQKKDHQIYLFVYNDTGFIIEIKLKKAIVQMLGDSQYENMQVKPLVKDSHQLKRHQIKIDKIKLSRSYAFKFTKSNSIYIKAHDKQIVFAMKVKLQGYGMLTVSCDGHLKYWGAQRKCLFDLKLPHLLKIEWNMEQLHVLRNKKLLKDVLDFVNTLILNDQQKQSPVHILNKNKKRMRNRSQKIKINLDNPIAIEIQSKQIEELIAIQPKFNTINVPQKKKALSTTQRIFPHPWRTKKQFIKIYQKASPTNKYKQSMPFDLMLMRNQLDMSQKLKKVQQKEVNLTILPELKNYQFQKIQTQKKRKNSSVLGSEQQIQSFESCIFVKTQRMKKKANELDEIDKFFNRKDKQTLNKKWVPKDKDRKRQSQTLEPKSQSLNYQSKQLNSYKDSLKGVLKIFQDHNRDVMGHKKGRFIRIPHMNLKMEQFYN